MGRLLVGATAGLNTVLVPLYIAEVAPVELRGGLGTVNQLAVTSGILTSQVLGLEEVLGSGGGWPWLLALTAVPPSVQLALLPFCPRSPRYLAISLGRPDEARAELARLRGGNERLVEAELAEMREEKEAEAEPTMSVLELLRSSALRPALVICVVMHMSQQLSGGFKLAFLSIIIIVILYFIIIVIVILSFIIIVILLFIIIVILLFIIIVVLKFIV